MMVFHTGYRKGFWQAIGRDQRENSSVHLLGFGGSKVFLINCLSEILAYFCAVFLTFVKRGIRKVAPWLLGQPWVNR